MKKLTAAVLFSALLLTACGDNKDDGEISEAAQTLTASIDITETTVSVGESGIIIHGSDTENTDAKQLTSAESAEITLLEENTESAAETTLTETESVKLNENAELCLSKLKFGMSRSEAEAAVDAELVEDALSSFYSIYNDISVDIDEKFNGAMFTYGESGLDEAALYSLSLTEEECAALRDRIIVFFSAAYGFSADDWELEENSDYCKKDGVSVFTRVYLSDGSYTVSLLITSWDHRSFKNQEQYPILP